MTLSMRVGHVIPPTHFGHGRHTDTYIYHAKSRLNNPVWGSLHSPNNNNDSSYCCQTRFGLRIPAGMFVHKVVCAVKVYITRIENVKTYFGRAKLLMDKYLLKNILIRG